jgi:phosphomevalonate kinase
MIARAPGKIVISGAYAVLEGAYALVAAVDRYVVADAARPADYLTPEVHAALALRGLADGCAPFFDASALRSGGPEDRKLGLGSSAAILVSSLAAIDLAEGNGVYPERILDQARTAHRTAQSGGSGIDVAASTLGGILRCRLRGDALETQTATLPAGTVIEIWTSSSDASTRHLLRLVREFARREPVSYRRTMDELTTAAHIAAHAQSPARFIEGCRIQRDYLDRLGRDCGASIVTPDVRAFDRIARERSAVVLPSGAGGGDICLWIGTSATDAACRKIALQAGLRLLDANLGAQGVHPAQSKLEERPFRH